MTPCLTGRLEDFILPQVIALVEAVQSSGHLEVRGPGGSGNLDFRCGQIVAARHEHRTGELAAYLILSWSAGDFSFVRNGAEPQGDIGHSNQALCLEAMRLVDESKNPGLSFAPAREAPRQDLAEPLRRVLANLQAGSTTVKEIALSCRMSPLEAYYHAEKLVRVGAAVRIEDGQPGQGVAEPQTDTIRVLVVDDSELMRRALTRLFESDPAIRVVGTAASGQEALAKLSVLRPDVISLDLHMPEMDGVTTLKRIMLTDPTPTVIVTASSPESLDLTFETILRFGAIDFITKPSRTRGEMEEQGRYVLGRLHRAARVNLRGIRLFQPRPTAAPRRATPGECSSFVLAVAGTGACLSFMQLLSNLPADLPFGVLGLLPFPDDFLRAFVAYMNKYSAFELRLATDGARPASGVCYFTNGSSPLRLLSDEHGPVLRSRSEYGPCDPNLLLYDTSQTFQTRAVGLVLSSESQDLVGGLGAIRAGGGMTLAQLPETCVDSEGPAEAVGLGLIDRTVVLNRISSDLSQFFMDRLRPARGEGKATMEGGEQWPGRSA